MGRESDDDEGRDRTPPTGVAAAPAEVELAVLRELVASDLTPSVARALVTRVLADAGGAATLALGARLAADRRRRPSWLSGLILGLATAPRAELWPVLALAADDAVPGALGALIACGPGAGARFLTGCEDRRARRVGMVCAGTASAGGLRAELAVPRGGMFSPVERGVLEELEHALLVLAGQVLDAGR